MANATVGVLMGSESDRPKMQGALDLLREFGVASDVRVLSAHRQAQAVAEYAESARSRGMKVIVAGAGLSAALPGAVASRTTVPVIGIPLNASSLGGLDALLSMAQMPPGVPVGCVGIDAAKNAALLALEILGVDDEALAERLDEYRRKGGR
jgi:phosphoribosylaminoimidazole carboxylase PurE protein